VSFQLDPTSRPFSRPARKRSPLTIFGFNVAKGRCAVKYFRSFFYRGTQGGDDEKSFG
jgi:hypothetical protein